MSASFSSTAGREAAQNCVTAVSAQNVEPIPGKHRCSELQD